MSLDRGTCAFIYLYDTVPRCFCGSTQDPKPPRLATPHSCGNSCSRIRVCGHPCPLPCHPGPCPPCMITIQNPCHCGKDVVALVCSRANPIIGGKVNLPSNRSCGRKCGKPLSCRNHVCVELCHDGECPPCSVTDLAKCWCGKERKNIACGEGDVKECKILAADGEESWTGKFGCDNPCERSVLYLFSFTGGRNHCVPIIQTLRLWYTQMFKVMPSTVIHSSRMPLFPLGRYPLSMWQTLTFGCSRYIVFRQQYEAPSHGLY